MISFSTSYFSHFTYPSLNDLINCPLYTNDLRVLHVPMNKYPGTSLEQGGNWINIKTYRTVLSWLPDLDSSTILNILGECFPNSPIHPCHLQTATSWFFPPFLLSHGSNSCLTFKARSHENRNYALSFALMPSPLQNPVDSAFSLLNLSPSLGLRPCFRQVIPYIASSDLLDWTYYHAIPLLKILQQVPVT